MEPQTIPETVSKYGCTMVLEKREGKVALYRLDRGRKCKGFEVLIVQVREAGTVFGKWNPGGEFLPSTSSWGQKGWSFLPTERDKAEAAFANHCKRFNPRKVKVLKRVRRKP